MSSQIFGCPHCSQRFQVGAEQAGQIVACPSCAQTVEIPASAFAAPPQPTAPDSAAPPASSIPEAAAVALNPIVACQFCQGSFSVPPELVGQQIACPHCQRTMVIGSPASEPNNDDDISFQIQTTKRKSKKRPKISLDEIEDIGAENGGDRAAATVSPPVTENESDNGPIEIPKIKRRLKKSKSRKPADAPVELQTPVRGEPGVETAQPVKPTMVAPKLPVDRKQIPPPEPSKLQTKTAEPEKPESPNPAAYRFNVQGAGEGLLPPRFEIEDPLAVRTKRPDEFKIFLPDAEGGQQAFDQRILHVNHEGEKISLFAQSPEEQRRRRVISNTISIIVGIVVLVLAFWLLTL